MNQQNRIPIGRINDAEIFAVSDPSGETFVPIKPICQALGIDFAAQYNKVKEDISFSPTIAIIAMVGADDKERDMVCLPIRRVYGWLYTINPGKVAPEAKEQVVKYRDICNDILYAHFSGRSGKMRELDSAEREAVARIEKLDKALKDAQQVVAGIKNEKAQASDTLEKIRAARLDDAPSLFD